MTFSEKYYIPVVLLDENSPILTVNNPDVKRQIRSGKFIQSNNVSIIHTGGILSEPKLNDYQVCPFPVISDKFKQYLETYSHINDNAKNIDQSTYIKAKIGIGNIDFEGFYIIYIKNTIFCLNYSQSEIRENPNGNITKIKKLSLDDDILKKIPLEERLLFKLGEKKTIFLFHECLIEFIQKFQPTGVKFIPVDEWYSTIMFHI